MFNVKTLIKFNLRRPMVMISGVLYSKDGSTVIGCSNRKNLACGNCVRELSSGCFKFAPSLQSVKLSAGLQYIFENALAV